METRQMNPAGTVKKQKKKGGKRPGNWEARLRMSFLYDAAKIMTHAHHQEEKMKITNTLVAEKSIEPTSESVDGNDAGHLELGCHYTTIMKEISRKTVTRMDLETKRSLCKNCTALLLPGITMKTKFKKNGSEKLFVIKCTRCNFERCFPTGQKPPKKPKK